MEEEEEELLRGSLVEGEEGERWGGEEDNDWGVDSGLLDIDLA